MKRREFLQTAAAATAAASTLILPSGAARAKTRRAISSMWP